MPSFSRLVQLGVGVGLSNVRESPFSAVPGFHSLLNHVESQHMSTHFLERYLTGLSLSAVCCPCSSGMLRAFRGDEGA